MGEKNGVYRRGQFLEEPTVLKSLYSEKDFIDEANRQNFDIVRLNVEFNHVAPYQRRYDVKIVYIAGSRDRKEIIYFETSPKHYENIDIGFLAKNIVNPAIDTIARRLKSKNGISKAVVNALHAFP